MLNVQPVIDTLVAPIHEVDAEGFQAVRGEVIHPEQPPEDQDVEVAQNMEGRQEVVAPMQSDATAVMTSNGLEVLGVFDEDTANNLMLWALPYQSND